MLPQKIIHVQPFLPRLITRLVKVVFIINNHFISSVCVYKSEEWEDGGFFLYIYMSKKVCVFSSPRYWHMLYYYCRLPITVAISVPHSAIQCNTLCLSAGFTRRRVFITPRQNMTFVVVLLKTFAVRSKTIITPLRPLTFPERETLLSPFLRHFMSL